MINKQKWPAKPKRQNSEARPSGPGLEGGGPQTYDGRANTNAGTPPAGPEASAFEGAGIRVPGDD